MELIELVGGLFGKLSCKGHAGKPLHNHLGLKGDRSHQAIGLYSNDGLQKAVHWYHGKTSAHFFRSPRRQRSVSWDDRLTCKMVL